MIMPIHDIIVSSTTSGLEFMKLHRRSHRELLLTTDKSEGEREREINSKLIIK
jgi:hypothetical protein